VEDRVRALANAWTQAILDLMAAGMVTEAIPIAV
jgi:hypothetical protein